MNNTLTRSNIRWELTERRITRKIAPYVLIVLAVSVLALSLEIWKLGQQASNLVYYVN